MKILITGGAGFIGSHLAEHLVAEGHEVVVLDNLSSGRLENLAAIRDRSTFVEGDIRDAVLLERVTEGCELIFHQAAVVSVPYSVEHPQETHDVNLLGSFNVLQAARCRGVRRVVLACSAAVYGDDPGLPKHEALAQTPIAPYGVEKSASEQYAMVFSRLYGVDAVSLRYFNVFGPRQDPSSPYSGVISIFVTKALAGQCPVVFGDGLQTRDFVFVEDVVRANVLAALIPAAAGRCYNVARGEATTLNELLAMIGRIVERDLDPQYVPARPGDIRHSLAQIDRARSELGYHPGVGVEEGLRRLIAYERARAAASMSRARS